MYLINNWDKIHISQLLRNIYDWCHEKIDLFRVHNWVVHNLSYWKCLQAYQSEKLFSGWLTNFRLFWYQTEPSRSSRRDFTKLWRPKTWPNFEPWTGLFSRDTRHMSKCQFGTTVDIWKLWQKLNMNIWNWIMNMNTN